MAKKLIFITLSLVILAGGIIGFSRLHYWERSVRIFDYREMDRRFEGRGERGSRVFDERSRDAFQSRGERGAIQEFRVRPEGEFRSRPERDSMNRTQAEFRSRPERDSMNRTQAEFRSRPERDTRERPEGELRERPEGRASFGPGDRGRGGHGRGDFRRGKPVRLRNVLWFLVVFSAFTVVTVYLDRAWRSFRNRSK